MINEEAIRLAVKNIEMSPENWDQRVWTGRVDPETGACAERWTADNPGAYRTDAGSYVVVQVEKCRTTFCFAGHAMLQANLVDEDGRYILADGSASLKFPETVDSDRRLRTVETVAAELLGLSKDQAEQIFYYGTSADPLCETEKPTVAGLKERVTRVTGVIFEE